jgi:hypothetical protein
MDDETMGKMFGPTAGKYVKYIRPLKKLRSRKPARVPEEPPVLHQISTTKSLDN